MMKKISLICVAALLCGSLAGCGNSQSKNSSKDSAKISSLKAENSSLKAKKHSSHKPSTKKDSLQDGKNNSDNTSQTSGKTGRSAASNTTAASKSQPNRQAANKSGLSPAEQANVDKGLEWDGTRKRSSFNSDADYQRYNAWHQGYNYDPSTGSLTPLNDQDMSYMRAQMNKDGGQSFQ